MTHNTTKWLALIVIAAMLFSFSSSVAAQANVISLDIGVDKQICKLDVLQQEGTWYANVDQLGRIAGCAVAINQENKTAIIYKNEPFVILYSQKLNNCIQKNGVCYVPLQQASVAAGICFVSTEPLEATIYRTPKEMIADISNILGDQRYQVSQILLTDGYAFMETTARIYSVLPFVGSGSLLGTISGSDELERYRNVFSSILTNDGSTTQFLSSHAELTSDVHRYADILSAAKELTQKGGRLYNYLLSKGISPSVLDALSYEADPYDYCDDLFEDWSSVLSAIDFAYFLDLCAFYAAAVDTEESIMTAMVRVFSDSKNPRSKKAVNLLTSARYGNAVQSVSDIYGGAIWNITMNAIGNEAEKIYGSYAAGLSVSAVVIDTVFQASNISDALIYFPIYSSVQQDLCKYYYAHRDDGQAHTMYDMRAVAIMYIKAALAAYSYAAFDKKLESSYEQIKHSLNATLANILSYQEQEYAPSYTNKELIAWLNSANGQQQLMPTPGATSTPALPGEYDESHIITENQIYAAEAGLYKMYQNAEGTCFSRVSAPSWFALMADSINSDDSFWWDEYLYMVNSEKYSDFNFKTLVAGQDQLVTVGYTSIYCKPILEMGYTIPYRLNAYGGTIHSRQYIASMVSAYPQQIEEINGQDPSVYVDRLSSRYGVLIAQKGERFTFSYYSTTKYEHDTVLANHYYYIIGDYNKTIDLPVTRTSNGYFLVDYSQLTPGYYVFDLGNDHTIIRIE